MIQISGRLGSELCLWQSGLHSIISYSYVSKITGLENELLTVTSTMLAGISMHNSQHTLNQVPHKSFREK